MSCGQAEWLHGYFDGELDAARAADFEAHLEGCADCTQALAVQTALRTALGAADLYARAPASLRSSVGARLSTPRAAFVSRAPSWRGLAAAASLVLVLVGAWRTMVWRADVAEREVGRQVLDAHLRSLQLNHLTDVASTDQHTVKPWFVGKLDFAPTVVDLSAEGFPLVGGRLDVVGGRSVAALVYNRRKHVINVFVWPSEESDGAPRTGEERGYTWTYWTRGGMTLCLVSDVAASDLAELARLLTRS
ncbi:MAG TPA: anti-sigma factor [Vicinamibacteria bacterium]|jgi:anti-sigma factor RsiW|nr:anti-sigma factor [Vicinamibacteria bacterium]